MSKFSSYMCRLKRGALIYEGCSESNASYFIILAHNIRGGCLWQQRLNLPTNIPLHFVALWQYGSRGAVWQNGFWHGRAYKARISNWIPPYRKKWHLLTLIDDCWMFQETKQWMWAQWGGGQCISAVVTAMWKTSHVPSRWPCTAVTSQNKECINQFIYTNQQITTRDLCTELSIGFNALETTVETLEYCKVCTR